MPPPEKKAIADGKPIQSYLNTDKAQGDPTAVLDLNASEADEVAKSNCVTYYVDEQGRYYYQPGENQSIMLLSTLDNNDEGIPAVERRLEEGGGAGSLLPAGPGAGELCCVLVVQEETPPVPIDDINIGQEEDKGNEDVSNLEEESVEQVSEEEGEEGEGVERKRTPNRRTLRSKFKCASCNYIGDQRYLLTRHMKIHSVDRPYKCQVCERGFKTVESFQNHKNMHNGVKPHVCKHCNSPFTTSGQLARHVRYQHTREKPHKCAECEYAAVELSKLRRHERVHSGERPYQCPDCTYAAADAFRLKRHMRTHTGDKPYKCDRCNMCFTQSNSLKAHKLVHNVGEQRVYRCSLCPAACTRKFDLRKHVQQLHTSATPLRCWRCGQYFPDRYSCKLHRKSHAGEECYKCGHCPYASTRKQQLASHMLKHADEQPFVRTEGVRHAGEECFKCGHCPYASTRRQHLNSHMLKHAHEQPFASTEGDQSVRYGVYFHNPDKTLKIKCV